MRKAQIERNTAETEIKLALCLDGNGVADIDSGCPFLNHMLTLLAAHSGFDLQLVCRGDVEVDYHHTTEDTGIVLGQALKAALGDKRGINRYGNFMLPMDEALVLVALDASGRSYLNWDVVLPTAKVGDFDTELAEEFMLAMAREAGLTLHFKLLAGHNCHHILEACFKGLGRALKIAVATDLALADKIPSTKGVL